jgi:hypothetical protein
MISKYMISKYMISIIKFYEVSRLIETHKYNYSCERIQVWEKNHLLQ